MTKDHSQWSSAFIFNLSSLLEFQKLLTLFCSLNISTTATDSVTTFTTLGFIGINLTRYADMV